MSVPDVVGARLRSAVDELTGRVPVAMPGEIERAARHRRRGRIVRIVVVGATVLAAGAAASWVVRDGQRDELVVATEDGVRGSAEAQAACETRVSPKVFGLPGTATKLAAAYATDYRGLQAWMARRIGQSVNYFNAEPSDPVLVCIYDGTFQGHGPPPLGGEPERVPPERMLMLAIGENSPTGMQFGTKASIPLDGPDAPRTR